MSLCRICLDEEPDVFQSIYTKKDDVFISEIFTAFGVEVKKGDKMPKYICLPCLESILSCYKIFQKIKSSDGYLRALYKLPSQNKIHQEKTIENKSSQTEDVIYTEILGQNSSESTPQVLEVAQNENDEILEDYETEQIQAIEEEKLDSQEIDYIDEAMEIEEKVVKTEYLCTLCRTNFLDESDFLVHLADHSSSTTAINDNKENPNSESKRNRPFVCSTCGKAFLSKQNLQAHKICHEEDKKEYICSICSKTCARKGDLEIHMISHSDSRPYVCELCPLKFKTKSHWNMHQKVHTKEKPYVCKVCGQAFGNYSDRKTHMLAHNGIHPFKCPDCGKNYGRNARLQDHIRRHHNGERPFSCDDCDMKFVQNWELMAHKKKKHEK